MNASVAPRVLGRLAGLAVPDGRLAAAESIARELGCTELLLFGPDPELGVLLPAPGMPQTFHHAAEWREFLEKCITHGAHEAKLPGGDGTHVRARGIAGPGRTVAVLTGAGTSGADVNELHTLLPLLGALFASERRERAAGIRIANADTAAARSAALARALETTRMRLESALVDVESSRAGMDAFFGALPMPAMLVDSELRFQRANTALAERYGLAVDEIVGRTLHEIVPAYAADVEPHFRQVLGTGEPVRNVEVRLPADDDGRASHFVVNYFPVRLPNGDVIGVGAVALDMTDRRTAEEQHREQARVAETLQHVGRELTADLDRNRIISAVIDAGVGLTGASYATFDTSVGLPSVIRVADITTEAPAELDAVLAAAGDEAVRSLLVVPVTSRTGDVVGGLIFGHSDAGAFEARHEQMTVGLASWAAVAIDNAQLFEAESEARAEAERANSAKGDFMAVMSHELRTPLNAILGYTGLLLAGIPDPLEPEPARKIGRIGLSARHLLELIEEILTFSRLEAGEERVEPDAFDARELADEVHALLEPLALEKELTLGCHVGDSPIEMFSDARKIRQILINLTSNAIKFTAEGSVEISVIADGDDVLFRVTDTGAGIPAEHHQQIFEPFWQVENHATRTAGGTGLGLSVTRRLARLLGGDATLDSEVGYGSTFTVRLPRNADGPPEAA